MIPLFRPSCSDLEVEYVTAVLRSGWWGIGPRTAELEERFAARVGTRHAVAVNSCTMALQLTLEGLGIKGLVAVPALTFASTALAVMHAGALPVFADIDEDTLCLDWASIKVQPRAVIPVWYAGVVGPVPDLGIPVVEDCAHAAGSAFAGQQGKAACWSFHAVKNLAAGDGGMVTTDDAELAERLRELRWCGITKTTWDRDRAAYGWEYDITRAGHKAHMNDITAAIALAQLERLDDLNKARQMLVRNYLHELAEISWLRLPAWRDDCSWHLFAVRVPAAHRDAFVAHMLEQGVSAGVHYKPLHHYPVFGPQPKLPVTDRVWQELVTLPLFPDMTIGEHAQVVAAVKGFKP